MQVEAMNKLLDFVRPVMSEMPNWMGVPSGEFKDDSIRICDGCETPCEWVFFKIGDDEVCSHCVEIRGKIREAHPLIREGVCDYVREMHSMAWKIMPLGLRRAKRDARRLATFMSHSYERHGNSTTSLDSLMGHYAEHRKKSSKKPMSKTRFLNALKHLGFDSHQQAVQGLSLKQTSIFK